MYIIDTYKTISGNCPIEDYLNDLSLDNQLKKKLPKIFLFINKLEEHGFEINIKFKSNAVKLVDTKNKIYELRPDNTRIFYFFEDSNQKYILLHAFTKKKQKAPEEIKKAIKEKKDYIRRMDNVKN